MSVAAQPLTDDDAVVSPWWIRRVLIVLSLVFARTRSRSWSTSTMTPERGAPNATLAFWSVGFGMFVLLMAARIPTPLYPLYEIRFRFPAPVLTMVFAAYVVGNLEVLLLLGSLSDQIGRRPVLRAELARLPALREEFWRDGNVPGTGAGLNQALEKAGRVADFLELAELMCIDSLHRTESAGGHFREESQTADGETPRDDEHNAYVAAWRHAGAGAPPLLDKAPLAFDNIALSQRSYK